MLTVHRAKGLEFGIVYLPFLWDRGFSDDRQGPVVFHDDDGERVLDVSLEGPGYDDDRAAGCSEERGEDLRLLYVALTRARHQAVVWWCADLGRAQLRARTPGLRPRRRRHDPATGWTRRRATPRPRRFCAR